MTLLVLLDTTILTYFALVGLTPIFRDLWGDQVATTEEVLEEYAAGVETEKLPPKHWIHLKTITLSSEEQVLGIKMFPKHGRGERSCLVVAIVRGAILATDDQLARRAALYQGIELIGTIGILKTCVQSRLLSRLDAQRKLEEMIAAGYYSPVLKLDFD
jgi:predicted nucleic acid-binding protein